MTKRVLDVVIAMAALVVLLPVIMLGAIAVKLSSPGPILFSHWRLGQHGKPFRLWKLRSMYFQSPDIRNPDGSAYTGPNDCRVTPIGRFLRATSLDELPQLLNVLRGDMSLVGPRPDLIDQYVLYSEEERRKLLVKPGLTGLAQISGRNAISWTQRKALDAEYVQQRSLRLDLLILLRTIPYVCLRRDVHN